MIAAKTIADSKNEFGDRITSMVVTFPRFILAELNTHRAFSRNSASSRAIPFKKMLKSVQENPFVPCAWQKDHKGMQGVDYFSKTDKFDIADFLEALNNIFDNDQESIKVFREILQGWEGTKKTLDEWWLIARDKALEAAVLLSCFGVTKQLCNRLLEPFMWHTVIITSTEFSNFFDLRCPQYDLFSENMPMSFKSKKDLLKYIKQVEADEFKNQYDDMTDLDWLKFNKGQAEIHMMALAEAMWDAYNESTPKELKAGEWHIPFGDDINEGELRKVMGTVASAEHHDSMIDELSIKIATARCARISYTVVGEEKTPSIEKDIELHDKFLKQKPFHASPFEHCARAMNDIEAGFSGHDNTNNGWSRNFKGFIQYRAIAESIHNN